MTTTPTQPSVDLHRPVTGSVLWQEPAGIAPRGTLVLLSDRGEAAAVYERFGRRLSADAYRVLVVPDLPFGGGRAGTVGPERQVEAAIRALADPGLPAPRVLAGSGAGAVAAVRLVRSLAGGDEVSTGAALPDAVLPDAVLLAGLPTAGRDDRPGPGSGGSLPVLVGEEIEARSACPNHQRVLRESASLSAENGTVLGEAEREPLPVPVLAVHGEADVVSPLPAAVAAHRDLGARQILVVAEGRHDILNDVTHRSVASSVVLFLERLRLGGGPLVRDVAS